MQSQQSSVLEAKTITKRKFSPRWRVIGHNDDVTPMNYVVMLLVDIFHKNLQDSFELMMEVHETGSASFYFGTREACELKIEQVRHANKKSGENLSVSMEPIEDEN